MMCLYEKLYDAVALISVDLFRYEKPYGAVVFVSVDLFRP